MLVWFCRKYHFQTAPPTVLVIFHWEFYFSPGVNIYRTVPRSRGHDIPCHMAPLSAKIVKTKCALSEKVGSAWYSKTMSNNCLYKNVDFAIPFYNIFQNSMPSGYTLPGFLSFKLLYRACHVFSFHKKRKKTTSPLWIPFTEFLYGMPCRSICSAI